MEGEDVTMFLIMSLPEEVRGQIYNFFEQKEAMELRQVCRQWREEIHTYYNYHLKLKDENPYLQNVLDRQRITRCTTVTFFLTPPNMTRIFKNSNLIQSLNISKDSVSPENLQALLTECAKSLKRLEVHFTNHLLRSEYPQTHFSFPNLRSLEVELCSSWIENSPWPPVLVNTDQEVLMITRLLRDSHKPKLSNLTIKLSYRNPSKLEWYSSTVLSTVANHSNTLSRISWTFLLEDFLNDLFALFPAYQLEQSDWARVRKVDSLKHVRISNYNVSDELATVSEVVLLPELAMTQKKLERLSLDVHVFEWPSLQVICVNCFGSLVSIEVKFLESILQIFDVSCLKDCKNLRELYLERRLTFEIIETDDRYGYSICNFHLLPETIVAMEILNISILTTELGEICSSGFKNLRKCRLHRCGVTTLRGVDGEVFQKLIQLPKLCKFAVKPLRFPDSEQEAHFTGFRDSIVSAGESDRPDGGISILRDSPSVPFREVCYSNW